jgi:putative ABC transport system substrate-binding protein
VKRREFIALAGGAAAWPVVGRAQVTAKHPVIGYLGAASPEQWAGRLQAFRQGMSETGYVESKNVTIEYRWADGRPERLGALAAELVAREVTAMVTPGSAPAALAAKQATGTIPVIFETGADPVAAGLVSSLNRPGGNLTGVTALSFELGPKRLELLHEMVPAAKDVALLVNPAGSSAEKLTAEVQAAARALNLQLHVVPVRSDGDFEAAFATIAQSRIGALMTNPDPFLNSRGDQLAALTLRHRVPAALHFRAFAEAGGLLSYGGSISDSHRLLGVLTGRVLKGEKPNDLPVMQATKVELIINLKTATAFGLTVPATLLARADEVIE